MILRRDFAFLSVCVGPQKLDKPNVIIYCGKLEDKGYKNPKESGLKNQQERRTKSYKIGPKCHGMVPADVPPPRILRPAKYRESGVNSHK